MDCSPLQSCFLSQEVVFIQIWTCLFNIFLYYCIYMTVVDASLPKHYTFSSEKS